MKFAAKLLSHSDLTLFAPYFRINSTSKQKGINLNGDVLAGQLYNALPDFVGSADEIKVVLDLYGPQGAGQLRLQRKILKPEGGKNWRLNGKLVEENSPSMGRFDNLAPGDVAIMAFDGDPLPTALILVLLSQSGGDAPIRDAIVSRSDLVSRKKSMVAISVDDLKYYSQLAPNGSILKILLHDEDRDSDLTGAGEGDIGAEQRLRQRVQLGRTRPVSAPELQAAKVRAQDIGRAGEVLINHFLEREVAAGKILNFIWSSEANAVSAWDFEIEDLNGHYWVDVKTTVFNSQCPFHLSAAELKSAASGERPYHIFRVFGVEDAAGAKLMRSLDIVEFARGVIENLSCLPRGVTANSLEISPHLLKWKQEELLPQINDDLDEY